MHLAFLTPDPDPPGGGRAFNAGLIPALQDLGHAVTLHHHLGALPPAATPVIDGLLLPDLEPHLDALVARDAVAIIHHVSAKAGRDPLAREAVRAIERRMIPRIRRIVATSTPVADRLAADFAATPHLLQPGLPDLPRSEGSGGPGPGPFSCRILSVGVLTPRKGHDRLIRALARLPDLDWTLAIAGDAQRDPVHAATLAALVDELNLSARVTLLADPTEAALDPEWRRADLFALATSWEGWPAGVAEALRRGLPAIAAKVGGIEAMLTPAAGIPYAPEDAATFSKCLRRAIFDGTLRAALAEGAWQAGQALPGWPQQAAAFTTLLES